MLANFAPIGQLQDSRSGDNSFWPSFTDIMMVITMIFLMATSLLVVRNWQLVAELRESIVAEQLAEQLIESTFLENVTLEERLANAEQSNSILRLRILKKDELFGKLFCDDAFAQFSNQLPVTHHQQAGRHQENHRNDHHDVGKRWPETIVTTTAVLQLTYRCEISQHRVR